MEDYLAPTYFIDCTSSAIKSRSEGLVMGLGDDAEKAKSIFYFVRDRVRYDPYTISTRPEDYRSSEILKRERGWCVQKATLLTSLGRAAGIPSRLGFADLRNHLSSKRLMELMGSDIFIYHGYSEHFLGGRWVKATPAFDIRMCDRNDIIPVEFDGKRDAVFSRYNRKGELHIEYIRYRGSFSDLPLEDILQSFADFYGLR
jgi:transglutaminase-like putative cysteine protease